MSSNRGQGESHKKTKTKLIPAGEPKSSLKGQGPGRLQVGGQPLPASGARRIARPLEIPVTKKTSRSQCFPVTITEIDSIPNSSTNDDETNHNHDEGNANAVVVRGRRSSQFQLQSSTSNSKRLVGVGETMGQVMEQFADTDSVFSTSTNASDEVTMIVPQNLTSYMVISSDNGSRVKHRDDDTLQAVGPPGVQNWLTNLLQHGVNRCSWTSAPYIGLGLLIFFFIFPITSYLVFLLLLYIAFQFLGSESSKLHSKRTVKWTIPDFSEEIRNGFLTCPPFTDTSGTWRLVISQKLVMEGLQTSWGLLATDIPRDIDHVLADIRFSCTNAYGVQLAPGMSRMKLQHRFERSGDLGFTKPVMFSTRFDNNEDTINVICRVDFNSVAIGYGKRLKRKFGVHPPQKTNNVKEIGVLQQETLVYQDSPSSKMQPLTRFVQHPETKTFAWQIPNFSMILKNKAVWGVYSPQFFVNTEDICSVWRMKLLEVSGVFRVHVQLRGLPKTHQQVRLWFLLQLVDSFDDSVVPEHSVSRIRYPDYLNLWDTSRHILYRKETLLSRFIAMDGSFTLRLSLQVRPIDIVLSSDSDEWISQ